MFSTGKQKKLFFTILGAFLLTASVRAAVIQDIILQGIPQELGHAGIEQLVYATIQSRKNEELNPELLSRDLENLYRTGHFEDIQTQIHTAGPTTVTLTFLLKIKAPVSSITFQGNTYYKPDKLSKEVRHPLGMLPDTELIAKDRKALEEKYSNGGYYGTTVESRIIPGKDGSSSTLTFIIKEQPRYKLQGVAFRGNNCFPSETLSPLLATRRQWWRYILRFGNFFNRNLLTLDRRNLKTFYENNGYLDFAVKKVDLRFNEARTWVTPVYDLYEGKQYHVGKITVSGQTVFPAQTLLEPRFLVSGETFSAEAERNLNDYIRNQYSYKGYLDLVVYPKRTINHEQSTVDVEFRIREGRPVRIGKVYIIGNRITQEKVIRRELEIHDGDLGNASKIEISKQRLKNLDYFSSVEILTAGTASPDIKDLRIELEEKKTGSLGIGAGFSSEDSLMGYFEFTETNYDISRILDWPQRGGGQRLRAYLGVGSEMVNMSLSFYEPAFYDSDVSFNTEFFINTRFEDEYDQRNAGVSFMFGIPLAFQIKGLNHKEYWNLGLGMTMEQIRISDVDEEPLPPGVSAKEFGYRLIDEEDTNFANRLVLQLTRNTLDRHRFPTRGSKLFLESELITAALGSYSNYARFSLGGEKFFPFYKDLILKTSMDFSSATHISGDDIGIFDRYFGGGYGTIRGFKRREVAPTVDEVNHRSHDDSPAGGLSMLMGTLELITPIKDFMYCSIFTDMGNVWWDEFECKPGDLNWSVGVGCQFKTLPVRLDYAFPISTSGDHLDGNGGRFHFNLQFTY